MENVLIIDCCMTPVALRLLKRDAVRNKQTLETVEIVEGSANDLLYDAFENLLKKSKKSEKDLTRIACIVGPGSFTGIRIGIAFAKGLKEALGIPAVGISSFDKYPDDGLVLLTCDKDSFYVKEKNQIYDKPVKNDVVEKLRKNYTKIYEYENMDDKMLINNINKAFLNPLKSPLIPMYIKGHYAEK